MTRTVRNYPKTITAATFGYIPFGIVVYNIVSHLPIEYTETLASAAFAFYAAALLTYLGLLAASDNPESMMFTYESTVGED